MKNKSIDTPFLPKAPVKTVLVDSRISVNMENNLRGSGIDIIKSPFCKELYRAISYHPDILIHPVNSNTMVSAPNVYNYFKKSFEGSNINIVEGRTELARNYPNNIAYNIGRVGKYVIHNFKHTDPMTLKYLKQEKELSFIHVKQGYSKCSIAVVNEKAIITSDRGIAKELEKYDLDVLCISPEHIKLPGFDYGFFGGIAGLIDYNKLAFTGHLKYHPDYKIIINFLKKYLVEPIFLDDCIPLDVGSIIPIYEMEY